MSQDADEDIGGWRHSHARLEWNGLVIDVTGGQLGWEPVTVTRTPALHRPGRDNDCYPVCLEHQRDWWARECGPLWAAISPHLPPRA